MSQPFRNHPTARDGKIKEGFQPECYRELFRRHEGIG